MKMFVLLQVKGNHYVRLFDAEPFQIGQNMIGIFPYKKTVQEEMFLESLEVI